jgi:pyridoxine kinase
MNQSPGVTNPKAVLVISSHVVRGTIGNRAIAFALEALGHPVWAVPTVTLPWHPGHGAATRIIPQVDDFSCLCDDLANAPWVGEIAAVITGFMASDKQALTVSRLVGRLKKNNPELVYLCDPVFGDFIGDHHLASYQKEGRLYVAESTASAIRDHLLPLANITTPNLFELSWLNGQNFCQNQKQMLAHARQLKVENVLVTSVPALMRNSVGSVLIGEKSAVMAEHKAIANPPNGLGDLTSALFLSHFLNNLDPDKALQQTIASVFEVLARTAKVGADELALEGNINSLSRPMAMVNMRALAG